MEPADRLGRTFAATRKPGDAVALRQRDRCRCRPTRRRRADVHDPRAAIRRCACPRMAAAARSWA